MSGFLYFIAGESDKPVTLDDARQWRLGHAFDVMPQSSPISGNTPTGEPGRLVWAQSRLGDWAPAYHADAELQQWEPLDDCDGVHVGMYRGKGQPSCVDLIRQRGLAGEPVQLGDGGAWQIPRLALWMGDAGYELQLPMHVKRSAGKWIAAGVAPAYRELQQLFERLFAQLSTKGSMDTIDCLDAACTLLATNYYVGPTELGLLGALVTDETLMRVVMAALDWETALDWSQKKSRELSLPGSAG